MPYEQITELPTNIRKQYSEKAQQAFMATFNDVFKRTGKDEARAFAAAHAAAKKIDGIKESVVAVLDV